MAEMRYPGSRSRPRRLRRRRRLGGRYKILRKDGYNVSIVQNPTLSLADDVAATKLILSGQDQPVVLAGIPMAGW